MLWARARNGQKLIHIIFITFQQSSSPLDITD
jgi:hypothetical protein